MQKTSIKTQISQFFPNKSKIFEILLQIVISFSLLIVMTYMFVEFYKVAKSDSDKLCENAVYEFCGKIENFMISGTEFLNSASNTVDFLLKNDASDEQIKKYLVEAASYFGGGEFTGAYGWIRGKYFDGSNWIPDENFSPKDRDWFISAVRAHGVVAMIPPYIDAKTGKIVISVSRMLSDFSSVVSIDLPLKDFQDYAKKLSIDGDGFGFILDKSSMIVAHSDKSFIGKLALKDSEIPAELKNIASTALSSSENRISAEFGGEKGVAFVGRVFDDITVVMFVPNRALIRKMQFPFSRIFLVFILISIFVFFRFSQTFRKKKELEQILDEQKQKISSQHKFMLEMQSNIIEELATLIEARDANTGEHVKNTKVYSVMMAKWMYINSRHTDEVNKKFIKDLGIAAPLHDIGKITIPDSVLLKRGKLSDFEYETMKNHTRFGGAIIRQIFRNNVDRESVQMAVDVAQYHHERFDGSGYPLQIAGDEIPLAARILAVADCFDALVSERCYKPPMPRGEAFDFIKNGAGTHFDPEIVEIFLQLRPKIEEHLDELKSQGIRAVG